MTDTYFIGYDAREHVAAAVAANSIKRRTTRRHRIFMLEHMALRRMGLFDRPWKVDSVGQTYDIRDTRPFSTAFSHTRFLAFYLAQELKAEGPCMFIDCDWLFLQDPGEVMAQQADRPNEVGVVTRPRVVDEGSTKMDGMVQQNYRRKLWSAMFTFVPSPDLSLIFSPNVVNEVTGRDLHGFMELSDSAFWDIDPLWHYIPSLDPPASEPKGIHYSEFSPWLNPDRYEDFPQEFDVWEQERAELYRQAGRTGELEVWGNLEEAIAQARA